ncbi:DNA polymerase III subunit gamma/tau [Vibrio salinus]|uniref:DNA polymerase III subunit gamma/tau n=1 Tax=Vibrio salinus TaxID=2899784 RepID=UPI001E42B7F5|nr:DNA polymerase III subunit gamma/tau [Vibrio salinus]MCE0492939.1 DNA polymerase III subunit gamma/tau [Vibrio salinus]
MSYLALARKWRPAAFSEVVGQAHVLTALENALDQNRLHHAYLFSGTRGVGKTTIARLLAKGLNCEKGITSHPCGECPTCKEIDEGRFVDLLEIDAASRTKVEDTRELLDNVQYKPARGRFKVYLIDEVHMLSRHSFNALLKTLEEPPEYVKFLLATTDPQKLPVTILSRCLQFHLKPISIENIGAQLEHIFNVESIGFEKRAVSLLAHAADGSMRDALSLSDQAISLGNGQVTVDHVANMLGTIDTNQALHILTALSHNNPQEIMEQVDALAQNGTDWDELLKSLAEQLHRLAMFQALPGTMDKSSPDSEKIRILAKAIAPEEIQLYYQIALKGRDDLALSPTPRIGLEMILLRMVAFRPAEISPLHDIRPPEKSTDSAAQSVEPVSPLSQPLPSHVAPEVSEPVNVPPPQAHYEGNNSVVHPESEPLQPSPVPQPVEKHKEETVRPVTRSSIGGLRHQLRSQRHSSPDSGSPRGKKSEAAAKNATVFERLANISTQNDVSPAPSHSQASVPPVEEKRDKPYRWTPMLPDEPEDTQSQQLTPSELKSAVEHEKTPEMTRKLVQEVAEKDDWARLIQQMNMPKLVEQLALNSSCVRDGSTVKLTLRANQQHLNTEKAFVALQQAISDLSGEPCHLEITIGEQGDTPLELREKNYQERLHQAYNSLKQDDIVQFIETRFNAELEKETVRPI